MSTLEAPLRARTFRVPLAFVAAAVAAVGLYLGLGPFWN